MVQRTVWLGAIFALTIQAGAVHGQPNPSAQNPQLPLAVHNASQSQELLARVARLYDKTLDDMRGILASGGKATARQLADAHVALRQLQRESLDLQMHGETAGVDYTVRVDVLQRQLQEALTAFSTNPSSGTQIARIRQSLFNPKMQQNVNRSLQNVQALAKQEKWPQAYAALQETFDQVTAHTVFLSAQEGESLVRTYLDRNGIVSGPRNTALRDKNQQLLDQAATALVPDTQGLVSAINEAAGTLRSRPVADVAGQTLNGPQCCEHFVRQWQDLQLSALRCRALDWARNASISQLSYLPVATDSDRLDDQQYEAFCSQVVEGLAGILVADTERADGAEAPELYAQYLQVLSPLIGRIADDRFQAAGREALERLRTGAPELDAQVAAYEAATDELLRWRQRVAAEASAARADQFPIGAGILAEAFVGDATSRGLLSANQPDLSQAKLMGSCPEALQSAAPKIVQQKMRFDRIVGLSGGELAVSSYHERHYATLTKLALGESVAALKRDLLVSDQVPPLSLAAAAAIASAEAGDLAAAGGVIEDVYLEGLIPRFATLPAAASPMIPLGPLPQEGPDQRLLLSHVLIRLRVQPSWVQHQYFFVELPPPTP